MKPGRELDKLIAGKVMGWTHIIFVPSSQDFVGEPDPNIKNVEHVPCFSTNVAAALEVIACLAKRLEPLNFQLQFSSLGNELSADKWKVRITSGDFDGEVECFAETAPHAICLAALKALGVDPTFT